MVHVRTIEGRPASAPPMRFGHSGILWHSAFLLYDRETDSLWHHLTGVAMSGPLRGKALRRLPSSVMPFGAWRREHPGTVVLAMPPDDDPRQVRVDRYARRTAGLLLGYGVDAGGASRFVSLDRLADGPAETDVGGVPVVVVKTGASTAAAFDRRVEGIALSFAGDTSDDGGVARPVLVEALPPAAASDRPAPGRRWWARSGLPASPETRVRLVQVTGSVWERAAWGLQHPDAPR